MFNFKCQCCIAKLHSTVYAIYSSVAAKQTTMDENTQALMSAVLLIAIMWEIFSLSAEGIQSRKQRDENECNQGLLAIKRKELFLMLILLILMAIYYLIHIYEARSTANPAINELAIHIRGATLKLFEITIEGIEKSLLFHTIMLFLPAISSKRFKDLGFDEYVFEAVLGSRAYGGILLYPIVFIVTGKTLLGNYIVDVINNSETLLLIILYFALLKKISKICTALLQRQLLSKPEVEQLILLARIRIGGILAYLLIKLILEICKTIEMLFSRYLTQTHSISFAKAMLFVLLCHFSIKPLIFLNTGAYLAIQSAKNAKPHKMQQHFNMVDITLIPSI